MWAEKSAAVAVAVTLVENSHLGWDLPDLAARRGVGIGMAILFKGSERSDTDSEVRRNVSREWRDHSFRMKSSSQLESPPWQALTYSESDTRGRHRKTALPRPSTILSAGAAQSSDPALEAPYCTDS